MGYLEKKYVNLLGTSLKNFKRKGGNLYNFSCPFCGDSQKNPRKARGYVYTAGDKMLYSCHNCGLTTSISNLIKHVSHALYTEYTKELMMEKYQPKKDKAEEWVKRYKKASKPHLHPLIGLHKVSELEEKHPCKKYVVLRQIPNAWFSRLFYAPEYMEWTNSLLPDKFSKDALKHDEGRLVIPFISKEGVTFGYQGRSLKDESDVRYITIILDESYPKIFGLDTVDQQRKFYVFEGPIDAMFIENSVACAGSELLQVASHLNKENAVLVFDNEPRSKEVCKKMQKAINLGYKVVVWPTQYEEKDVNELIMKRPGFEPNHVKFLLQNSIYGGLMAQLHFDNWRKI